jgi:hypothetical protein
MARYFPYQREARNQRESRGINSLQRFAYVCRAFDSFAPALSPGWLPVYVARVPAASFCEPGKHSGLTQAPYKRSRY